MLYAIFCSIFRSLLSVFSAVHSPFTGPVDTYILLLYGQWVGVLVIRGKYRASNVLNVRCLHQYMVCSIFLLCFSDSYNM